MRNDWENWTFSVSILSSNLNQGLTVCHLNPTGVVTRVVIYLISPFKILNIDQSQLVKTQLVLADDNHGET